MSYFRGLRARILLLLGAAVLPIFGLVVLWSIERDRDVRQFQDHAAAAAIDVAGERLGRLTDQARAIRAIVEEAGTDACGRLTAQLAAAAGFDGGLLVTEGASRCAIGDPPLEDAVLAALRGSPVPGEAIALANDGGPAGRLVLGLRLADDPAGLLALRVSAAATDRLLDPGATPFLAGLALLRDAQPIVERHLPAVAASWWPVEPPAGLDGPAHGLPDMPQADGARANFFVTPILGGTLKLVGLRIRPFLGTDQWRLWSAIMQLAAVLCATMAATLWAIDRSVLRWIDYLRRIAIAHSRGHHSVRARRLATAPQELADLGESLNSMANDAGRQVALLRQSAAEKSALLLELHHRVKNNFQVITSLLSLVRLDLPAPRRGEFRLVEDFVRAMAVAYRVAYDSGDVTGVSLQDLVRSTVEALRELAGTPPDRLALQIEEQPLWLPLDKAISLGLYLAVTLPPYLDAVGGETAARATLSARRDAGSLWLAIGGAMPRAAEEPGLRRRLRDAYVRQLRATIDPLAIGAAIRVPLDNGKDQHRLAAVATAAPARVAPIAGSPDRLDDMDRIAAGAGITLSSQDSDLRYAWVCGAELFGHGADSAVGRTDAELFPPAAATMLQQLKVQVLAQGGAASKLVQLGDAGAERWFAVHVEPVESGHAHAAGVLCAWYEVTAHKASERRMAVLLREMAHRSKNILAVIEAMARQSLAQAASLEDFGGRFSARLHSLAGSHDLLTRRDWEGAELQDLLRSQLGHYLLGDAPQISAEGPEILLAPTTIPYLGLALHELSTNAAKHGALSVPEGRVAITWERRRRENGQERLLLKWVESGGPPVVPPARRGFGAEVTRRILSRALRGEVVLLFEPDGVIWQLDAPTERLTARPR